MAGAAGSDDTLTRGLTVALLLVVTITSLPVTGLVYRSHMTKVTLE